VFILLGRTRALVSPINEPPQAALIVMPEEMS
jgi:hypothetical protein